MMPYIICSFFPITYLISYVIHPANPLTKIELAKQIDSYCYYFTIVFLVLLNIYVGIAYVYSKYRVGDLPTLDVKEFQMWDHFDKLWVLDFKNIKG